MNEKYAVPVLKEAKAVLDANNVEFWLNFGGLLGAVRDGRLISYDDDIELNAWTHKLTEDRIKKICRELCARGFSVYYSRLTNYISIRKHNVPISFSTYNLENGKAVRPHEPVGYSNCRTVLSIIPYFLSEIFARQRVGKVNCESICGIRRGIIFLSVGLTHIFPCFLRRKIAVFLRKIAMRINGGYGKTGFPAKFYLELEELRFYGMTFKVPGNTREYLEFIYGPDWKTPIKDWDFYAPDKKSITKIEFIKEGWDYK